MSSAHRQADNERRAPVRSFAEYFDRPSVKFYYFTHDCETKSQTCRVHFRGTILLPEPLEHKREELAFDTLPRVRHDAFHVIAASANPQSNTASLRCKFHGIIQEVHQNLL